MDLHEWYIIFTMFMIICYIYCLGRIIVKIVEGFKFVIKNFREIEELEDEIEKRKSV